MQRSKSIEDQIQSLPKTPGVYFFKNKSGEVLYVGKATSLRDRIRSYWSDELNRGRLIEQMIPLIKIIDYKPCDSEMEALILEANYIKHLLPKYNIKLKDDKGYYFVKIATSVDKLPTIEVVHQNQMMFDQRGVHFFGPYTSRRSLNTALKFMRRVFPINFDQLLLSRTKNRKIITPALSHKEREECGGKPLRRLENDLPVSAVIADEEYHKLFKRNLKHVVMFLEGKKEHVVLSLKREMEKLSRQKKYEEAIIIRNKYLALQHLKNTASIIEDNLEVKKDQYATTPHRIEGYDVSNTAGKEPVVSMVVFINGKPVKSLYRKFAIRNIVGPNDTAMLAEAIDRRFSKRHFAISTDIEKENPVGLDTDEISRHTRDDKEKWGAPDLIVIDGGRGQVNAVQSILVQHKLTIPITGIAKGPQRKHEDLYFINDTGFRDLSILRTVRDEAHRFAIKFHRQKRSKSLIRSELGAINGIGVKTSHKLLKHFGSYDRVINSPDDELIKIVGSKIAQKIKNKR